jgi:plastocyanin
MRCKLALAGLTWAAVAFGALPAGAEARTHLLWAGGTPAFQSSLRHRLAAVANDFFPHSVTLDAGDTVQWRGMSTGSHSIDVPRKGGADLQLIAPTGTTAANLTDFAGSQFWFNGQPNLGLNPQLFAPSGGNTYNGSGRAASGLPLGKPRPFRLMFTKPGTYEYFCDVHYDMRGLIVVKAKGVATPTAAQESAAVATQQDRDTRIAKALTKTNVTGRVSLGVAGRNNVEILAMFPRRLKVRIGASVSFSLPNPTGETHTATFASNSYLKPLENSIAGPTPTATAVYPSSPNGPLLLPGPHGNGFANAGVLERDDDSHLKPGAQFMFTVPGTYNYVCLIHPFMQGTVVVVK